MSVINSIPLIAAGDDGYQISRSVRLRSSASAYLSETFGTPTNNKIWTWSGWVKRSNIGSNGQLFAHYTSDTQNNYFQFSGDVLSFSFDNGTVYAIATSAVFRDPSAWYHVVIAVDTTQATAANRTKLYVNGVEQTVTGSYVPQNTNTYLNGSGRGVTIGRRSAAADQYLDGYLTEINFIDGQALTPSSFGETNPATGVWQPKKYAGTYGTNGFYLNFSDNSAATATTIGKDYSGNGNNWTPNNISVTAGVTYDSMTDVPTLTSATAANFCTLNPLSYESGTYTLSNANLTYAGSRTASATAYTRSTISVSSGKWYWEAVATNVGVGPNLIIGVQDASTSATTGLTNTVLNGYGYNGAALKYDNAGSVSYGATWTNGDVIGIAFDLDAGTITFYKNNVSQGIAFSSISGTYCPVIVMTTAGVARTIAGSINFGQRPFTYTPPTGFLALNTQNLPASTISNGAAYMAATLWTGNGTSQSISNAVNGISFQPDMVWVKDRSAARSHVLIDAVRGTGLTLFPNETTADQSNTDRITSFNSNGFSVGAGLGTNANTETYVGWQWNAGGSTVTNTSGTISSQVRANPTAGFSVVTYTGTGANATVGHGLGVAPKMVIVKNRGQVDGWAVYHANQNASPASGYTALNETAAFATTAVSWNNTVPTSTVFSVGTSSRTNASAVNMVAYCFAAVAGYSAFGSYTGNGSADGPFVYLGFRPRFVMIKRTDSTGVWSMVDTARNTYNQSQALLTAQSSAVELSSAEIDALSNGFKYRGVSTGVDRDHNVSSATYIYMAFAENPFKNSLAR